ncbi:MAG: sulfurtransferase TusA family protein [Magnetovibrio sp.]|nr:sulfurtransferase TusA family protein [Magnetovibrio sp.]
MKITTLNTQYNHYLDITSDICPLTFVRTKLLLERMKSGETAQVRLQGQMPLEKVPRSVQQLGEIVVSLEQEDPQAEEFSPHLMVLQKT